MIHGDETIQAAAPAPSTGDEPAAIYARRRAQLRMLIDQRTAGNVAAFADQFGYSRSRVSQFLSESYNDGRSIGERAARAMEEAAGLAVGWLDGSEPAPAAAPDEGATVHETLVLILRELRANRQERLARSNALMRLYDTSVSRGASLPACFPHLPGIRSRSGELAP